MVSKAMTRFSLIADSSGTYSKTAQITGKAHAANHGSPTPSMTTTGVSNMETAYTDAAGRSISDGTNTDIKAGLIAEKNLR